MHPGPESSLSAEVPGAGDPASRTNARGGPAAPLSLRLRLDRGPDELADARHRLRDWLDATGVREPQLGELLVAAGEAWTNAYEHSGATGPGRRGRCRVDAHVEHGRIHLRICDPGRWKTPRTVSAGDLQLRGRGRMLMAALADTVNVDTGAQGTSVELIARIRTFES